MKMNPTGLVLAFVLAAAADAFAANESVNVSLLAQSDAKNYVRKKHGDGTYVPETYVMIDGREYDISARDFEIDHVPFTELAGILGHHLAKQNYLLTQNAADADLLLLVHWGTTIPFNDVQYASHVLSTGNAMANLRMLQSPGVMQFQPGVGLTSAPVADSELQAEAAALSKEVESQILKILIDNEARDRLNARNASLLGYHDAMSTLRDAAGLVGGPVTPYRDLVSDVEEPRYYVTVEAYDFRQYVKARKKLLRWVVRLSIRTQGNAFEDKVAAMIATAAPYFGENSSLKRVYKKDATVDLAEIRYLGIVPVPKKPQKAEEPTKAEPPAKTK